jgi:ribulose-5-phosphate 4-epimerase/fuculose-1-phosphate aldolase
MTDLVFTHITAKLPGSNAFLINPYGMLFDEITASSLVKVDDKCNKIEVRMRRVNLIMLRNLRMLSFSM